MDIICQPLVAAMRRSWLQLVFRGTLVLIVLGTLACLAAQLDFVGTHFTALSRLLLIKVLPIWNWQPLYYENCMINNPFYNDYTITEEDCVVRFVFLGSKNVAIAWRKKLSEHFLVDLRGAGDD